MPIESFYRRIRPSCLGCKRSEFFRNQGVRDFKNGPRRARPSRGVFKIHRVFYNLEQREPLAALQDLATPQAAEQLLQKRHPLPLPDMHLVRSEPRLIFERPTTSDVVLRSGLRHVSPPYLN